MKDIKTIVDEELIPVINNPSKFSLMYNNLIHLYDKEEVDKHVFRHENDHFSHEDAALVGDAIYTVDLNLPRTKNFRFDNILKDLNETFGHRLVRYCILYLQLQGKLKNISIAENKSRQTSHRKSRRLVEDVDPHQLFAFATEDGEQYTGYQQGKNFVISTIDGNKEYKVTKQGNQYDCSCGEGTKYFPCKHIKAMSQYAIIMDNHPNSINIEGVTYEIHQLGPEKYEITKPQIYTNPRGIYSRPSGGSYTIEKKAANWVCDCPGFRYNGDCKHLVALTDAGIIKRKIRHPISMVKVTLDRIAPLLDKHCSKWEPVGSYRRQSPTIGDIDLIVWPRSNGSMIDLAKDLKNIEGYQHVMSGDTIVRGRIPVGTKMVDLDINNMREDYNEGGFFVYRTGPRDLNIFMRKMARAQGLTLSEFGLKDHITGDNIPVSTEKDIFDKLNLPYIAPKDRDRWDKIWDTRSLNRRAYQYFDEMIRTSEVVPAIMKVMEPKIDFWKEWLGKSKSKTKLTGFRNKILREISHIVQSPYKEEVGLAWYRLTGEKIEDFKEKKW